MRPQVDGRAALTGSSIDDLPARLRTKVDLDPEGCWPWIASTDRHGYGHVRWDGRLQMAHRVVYEMFVGPIPEGAIVHHQCHYRRCVNPAHLHIMRAGEHQAMHIRQADRGEPRWSNNVLKARRYARPPTRVIR